MTEFEATRIAICKGTGLYVMRGLIFEELFSLEKNVGILQLKVLVTRVESERQQE